MSLFDRWSVIEPVLDRALDLPPADRTAFLQESCGDDVSLRTEVQRLLDASDAAGERFLERPAFVLAAALFGEAGLEHLDAGGVVRHESEEEPSGEPDDLTARPSGASWAQPEDARQDGSSRGGRRTGPGHRVGPYRVVREIGRGGMGTVYLAERADGAFEQHVALKVVNAGLLTESLERHFVRERQILARLEHAGIARLLHGGLTPQGSPYLAMELVDGKPITAWAEARALDVDARLRLFLQVCDAVQYAHRQLVVHRDLKPSNIVVTPEGRARLLDFGIARLLSGNGEDETSTRTGLLVLTPEYAAPEQLRGEAATTSTDVYGLGVVLYELLARRRPFERGSRSWSELVRLADQDPPPPSRTPGLEQGVRRQLAGDLDAVVRMALRNEPNRRYSSVEALTDDIRSYLDRRPVRARPDVWSYRAARFVRRHAVSVAAALLVALSLVAGLAGTAWQAQTAAREATKAQEISVFLTSLFELSDPDVSNAERFTARQLLDVGARRVDAELRDQPEVQAQLLALLGEIHRKLGLFERADSLLARALALRLELFGARHPDVAAVLVNIGTLRSNQGRVDEAEPLLRQALALREARLGERHPDVARSLRELAAVLRTTGDLEEAESLLRRGLAIDLQAYGPVHAEVASDLAVLSNILADKDDYGAAIDASRRALDIRREVLGEEHFETAIAKNQLALRLSQIGELDDAEALYREVLAFDIDRLGEEHPHTATVSNNLAIVLQRKGDFDAAEELYRWVLDLDIRLFGEVHPNVAIVMNNLAIVHRERGTLDESEILFRDALAMFRQLFGEEHPSVGTAHALLAETRFRQRAYEEADSLFLEAIGRLRASFPAGHLRTAAALFGRGRLLTATARAPEAESMLREALALRERALGPDEVRSVEARQALGDCLIAQDRFAEAEPLLLQAWTALDGKRYVERHRRELAASLIELYERWGRPTDAEPYRLELSE